ncbi:MAG TPA: hypothetical protein PKD10_16015 [Paracoccaceae bacterium]|nr:hypothetical protein [Paracoccaceae bacterium]
MPGPTFLRRLAACALAGLSLLLAPIALAQEAVRLPGTTWSIVLPEGLAPLTRPLQSQQGQDPARLVVEQYAPDGSAFPPPRTGTVIDGVRLDTTQRIERPDGLAFLSEGVHEGFQATVIRFDIATATSTLSAFVIVPGPARPRIDLGAIRSALQSMVEGKAGQEEWLAGFPLVMPEMPGMRLVSVIGGTVARWTDGPVADSSQSATQRFIRIAAFEVTREQAQALRRTSLEAELAEAIRSEHPAALVTKTHANRVAGGYVSVAFYQRRHETGPHVQGVSLARVDGQYFITFEGHSGMSDPLAHEDFYALFMQIRARAAP